MSEGKFKISEEQKQQLIQALVTLLTVLVSIALTLATQAVSDWIDRPEPVGEGEPDAGGPVDVFALPLMPLADVDAWIGKGVMGRVPAAMCA